MPKQVKVLRVIAKRDGFRRASMEFGSVPKNLPLDSLSPVVLTALKSDPMLVAYEIDMVIDDDGNLSDLAGGGSDADGTRVELDKRKAELEEQEAALKLREAALDSREAALQAREAAVAEAEKTKPAAGADKPKATSR